MGLVGFRRNLLAARWNRACSRILGQPTFQKLTKAWHGRQMTREGVGVGVGQEPHSYQETSWLPLEPWFCYRDRWTPVEMQALEE